MALYAAIQAPVNYQLILPVLFVSQLYLFFAVATVSDMCNIISLSLASTQQLNLMFNTSGFQSGQTCLCTIESAVPVNFSFYDEISIADHSILSCNRAQLKRIVFDYLITDGPDFVQFLNGNASMSFAAAESLTYEIRQHGYFAEDFLEGVISVYGNIVYSIQFSDLS